MVPQLKETLGLEPDADSAPPMADRLFYRLLDSLPAAGYTCDAAGLITHVNQHAVRLWGRAPKLNDPGDRFCGSFKLYAPDGSPISHEECWMALALRLDTEFNGQEIVIERPDGSRVTVLAHANPIHDDAGRLLGAVNVLVDITDRKRAEEEGARLAAIVESSDDAIVGKTLDGIITSWNRSAESMFGYTAAEAVGQHISLIIPPERRAEEDDVLARLRRGEKVDHFDTVRQTKDGRRLSISLTVSPVKDAKGRVIGASKVARDITERRLAEEALRRAKAEAVEAQRLAEAANRAKSEFLASMSHELRTPLNAILGYAELVEIGIHGPVTEGQRVALERLRRSGEHLLGLVNDVLNFAKIEAGAVQYEIAAVPIDKLLLEIEALIAPQVARQRLRYRLERCDPAITAWIDAEKAKQIVVNLLTNAIKFTAPGGQIAVAVRTDESWVMVEVRDTGIGIAPDKLEVVFEPFVQAGRRLNQPGEGVGLGLAISRDLARAMGGELRAESTVGVGSTFTLTLPRHGTVER